MSEETERFGVSLEDFFDAYDEDLDSKVRTKLEVIANNIHYSSSGQLTADLTFHIKLYDSNIDSYRDIYRKTISNIVVYDVKIYDEADDLKVGRLERILQDPGRLAKKAISDYENFLKYEDSKYNEVDIDDNDTFLYDFRRDVGYLPKVYPIDFSDLIIKLYLSFANYNPNKGCCS